MIIIRQNRFLQRKRYRLFLTFSVGWSVCLSVCLSVICHIHAPCFNRSTDLYAIWQVHLWGPRTHCVRWGPWPPRGRVDLWAGGSIDQRFRLLPNYFGACYAHLVGSAAVCLHLTADCVLVATRRWVEEAADCHPGRHADVWRGPSAAVYEQGPSWACRLPGQHASILNVVLSSSSNIYSAPL